MAADFAAWLFFLIFDVTPALQIDNKEKILINSYSISYFSLVIA